MEVEAAGLILELLTSTSTSPPSCQHQPWDSFLLEIGHILQEKDAAKLQDYLILEPPLPTLYTQIVGELRKVFPQGNAAATAALESKCDTTLPKDVEGDVGGTWPAFLSFLTGYLAFLRDVNADQLVETHDMLKALLKWDPLP